MRRPDRLSAHLVCAAAAASLLLAGSVPAAAAPQEAEAKTLLAHLKDELEVVRLQLINAGARVRGGAVSLGADPAATPGLSCCEANVRKIQAHLGEMSAIWGELRECYRAEDDAEAEIQANFVRDDATSLLRALQTFVSAPNLEGTAGGHAAMIRAYRQVVESADKLADCGEPLVRPPVQ